MRIVIGVLMVVATVVGIFWWLSGSQTPAGPLPSMGATPGAKAFAAMAAADRARLQGDFAAELKAAERAVALADDLPQVHWRHAFALAEVDADRAVAVFERGLQRAQGSELHHFGQRHFAHFLLSLDRTQDAIAAYMAYFEANPGDDAHHVAWGQALLARGHGAEAFEAFTRGISLNKASVAARLGRARALLAQNLPQKARALLIQDLRLVPKDPFLSALLVRVLAVHPLQEGDPQLAVRLLQDVAPEMAPALLAETRMIVGAANGRFSEVIADAQWLLSLAGETGNQAWEAHLLGSIERLAADQKLAQACAPTDLLARPKAWAWAMGLRPEYQRGGRFSMPALLADFAKRSDIQVNAYLNDRRMAFFEAQQQAAQSPGAYMEQGVKMAKEQLRAGDSEGAIRNLLGLLQYAREHNFPMNGERQNWFLLHLALANLRLGEQENCIFSHNAQSCLYPIQGEGVHREPRGSRGAILFLERLLQSKGNEGWDVRWLLNLAHMTLGNYPEGVPASYRTVFPNLQGADFPRFLEIAGSLGLDVDGLAGGVIAEDFNGDGFLDLMVSSWGLEHQLRYFENRGDGSFEERTEAAGLLGQWSGLNLMQCDYDNDGDADVWVLRGAWLFSAGQIPNSLLRNNGDGTFSDVTLASGLLSFHPTQTSRWTDINQDGWQDVLIGNESSAGSPHPLELYINRGDGTFENLAAEAGADLTMFAKAVAEADVDHDWQTDFYISCYQEPNRFLHNQGPSGVPGLWRFKEDAAERGIAEPVSSFPAWFFDYDQDGWNDLLVCDYADLPLISAVLDFMDQPHQGATTRLYRNLQGQGFEDVSAQVGLDHVLVGMGSNFGDLDNDGWLDLYIGTGTPNLGMLVPNRIFHNLEGTRFEDVSFAGGFGHLQKGHGVAFADLDNDGDQDIYATMGGAYSGDNYRNALFHNPGFGNNWLVLSLRNRWGGIALGARVVLRVEGPGGDRLLYRTLGSGGSFGAAPTRMEIGLGTHRRVTDLWIYWPAGQDISHHSDLEANQHYRIHQNRQEPEKQTYTAIQLNQKPKQHQH